MKPLLTLFYTILLVLTCTSCSFSSSAPGSSREISGTSPGWQIELLNADPNLYRLSPPAAETVELYVTAIEGCGLSSRSSAATAARQLFIGLGNLSIVSQESLNVGEFPCLQTKLRALYENRPLYISAYTFKKKTCALDYVVWSQDESALPFMDTFRDEMLPALLEEAPL